MDLTIDLKIQKDALFYLNFIILVYNKKKLFFYNSGN